MTGRVEYQQYDAVRWVIAALVLASAGALSLNLLVNAQGSPARLGALLALPILLAASLCVAQRARRWARWLAIYGWIAALVLYIEPVTRVWPFGALTLAVIAALNLTASLLIPDPALRRRPRGAPSQAREAA